MKTEIVVFDWKLEKKLTFLRQQK